jgi:hypothetical protein
MVCPSPNRSPAPAFRNQDSTPASLKAQKTQKYRKKDKKWGSKSRARSGSVIRQATTIQSLDDFLTPIFLRISAFFAFLR